jgi:DNA polymerase III subunit delta'
MSFKTLVGNERNKEILKRLLQQKRLGATFVFSGPEGVGKRQFALTLAKSANCAHANSGTYDSCDECPSCQRIGLGTHSDVVTVRPDGNFIKVDQARDLARELFFRPREGVQRFFIIDEADRLREEAASALLKTLEEPPLTSTIMLITSRPASLLSTVLSRAQRIPFSALSHSEMETYLTRNFRRPQEESALLARVTEGRIGQATAIDLSVYRKERRELLELIELLAGNEESNASAQPRRVRLMKAAEHFGKLDRPSFEKMLNLLIRLLRDLLILAANGPESEITNIDERETLARLAHTATLEKVIYWSEKLSDLRENLIVNVNLRIALDDIFQSAES